MNTNKTSPVPKTPGPTPKAGNGQPKAQKPISALLIPLSIVAAGLLIAGGIFASSVYTADKNPSGQTNQDTADKQNQDDSVSQAAKLASAMDPITAQDHIMGSPEAKVKIVEYSDLDCPFCSKAHQTIKQLLAEYGSDKIAWVYRHYPIPQLHPYAALKSRATECAFEQKGETGFWNFVDAYFLQQDPQAKSEELIILARSQGLDVAKFSQCLSSNKYDERISAQAQNAVSAGSQGTPYFVLVAGANYVPIKGALPIASFQTEIDKLLEK